jgi:N-acetylglucosamine kinase-like BadF-type ATPase
MTVVLGVDGGNTKTVALIARADGTVIGTGRGGCADVYGATSPEAAVTAITTAVEAALAAAGVAAGALERSVFALAGADWPEDYALHGRELPHRLGLSSAPTIINDSIGAIRSGTPDGVGVAVVAGTGGAIGARNAAGTAWHLGFWPDGMGGRALGRAALRAVYRHELGLDPATTLTRPVLAAYGAASPLGLLHEFTRRDGLDREDTARLAPVVLDEAGAGDPVAVAILEQEGLRLGEAASVVAARVGLTGAYPLVLTGGVLRNPAAGALAAAIAARVPAAVPVRPSWEPAVGALLLAFDAAGVRPDEALLRASLPGADLFDTR